MIAKKHMTMDQFMELVVDEFANMRDEFKNVHACLANMELDIHEIKEEQLSMNRRIVDTSMRLAHVEDKIDEHTGFAKEIDYAFHRIGRIEEHIGLPAPARCAK